MKPRDILVATHGYCFDGMTSAALFTHLRRTLEPGEALTFRYKSCGYGPNMQMIPEGWLDGSENVILDFRYTPSKKLSWYFDHHVTGFGSPEERETALATAGAAGTGPAARPQVHFDPASSSCAGLIARVASSRFGVSMDQMSELIEWAEIIDAARFSSAEAATRRDEPALQLAGVVEHHGDAAFLLSIIPRLLERPLNEVARSEDIQRLWQPIAASRASFTERIKARAEVKGRVVYVDLTDAPVDISSKFVTYALYPRCAYSVMLARHKQHLKLSIGYNPWSGVERTHDIAAICRREGGGGHPVVGACAFPLPELERARSVAKAVVRELDEG